MVHALRTHANPVLSWSEIGRILNKDRRGLQRWHERYSNTQEYQRQIRSPQRKTTPREDRLIIRHATNNPHDTCQQIIDQLNLNVKPSTISDRLKEAGIRSRFQMSKFFIPRNARLLRLDYCRRLKNWSRNDWSRVAWSDESVFTLVNQRPRRVWRRKNQADLPEYSLKKHQYPKKLMVWGCISYNQPILNVPPLFFQNFGVCLQRPLALGLRRILKILLPRCRSTLWLIFTHKVSNSTVVTTLHIRIYFRIVHSFSCLFLMRLTS